MKIRTIKESDHEVISKLLVSWDILILKSLFKIKSGLYWKTQMNILVVIEE